MSLQLSEIPPNIAPGLAELGVVTLAQVAELPHGALERAGQPAEAIALAQTVRQNRLHHPRIAPHAFGALRPEDTSPALIAARAQFGSRHDRLLARLDQLTDLPTSVSLVGQFPAVGNQLNHGACVGFATSYALEFLTERPMSPWAAHRAAKELDNMPHEEGSLQYFALTHFFKTGHLRKPDYRYEDWLNQKRLAPLAAKALPYQIDQFADLLAARADYDYFPRLARAVLAGQMLESQIAGPRTGDPVTISIALYESCGDHSAQTQGMLRLPLPGEKMVGGHAMVIVGYRDADDPENPFGIGYFIVRNSWGNWAADNPFGFPGHALIPYSYFTDRARLFEAYWLFR